MRISNERILSILGPSPKPEKVWQRQFDHEDDRLVEMAQMDWDAIPRDYLGYYFLDMVYMELQPDLFRYVFPTCLKFWYDTLMNNEAPFAGDQGFHNSLKRGNIIEKFFTNEARESLYSFFRDGFIDRIEAQSCFYNSALSDNREFRQAWVGRFNSLGVIAPVIPKIWEAWWSTDHPGKALCLLMYSSGFIYPFGDNPIYGRWTHEKGGGGPYLTENDDWLDKLPWMDENLQFLRSTLSVDYILEKTDRAAYELKQHPDFELANRIANDAKQRTDLIASQIELLLKHLAKPPEIEESWDFKLRWAKTGDS